MNKFLLEKMDTETREKYYSLIGTIGGLTTTRKGIIKEAKERAEGYTEKIKRIRVELQELEADVELGVKKCEDKSKKHYFVNRNLFVTEKQIEDFIKIWLEDTGGGFKNIIIKSLKVDRKKGEVNGIFWGEDKTLKKVGEHSFEFDLDEVIRYINKVPGMYFGCVEIFNNTRG